MKRWIWVVLVLAVLAGSVYFYLRTKKSDDFEGLIKTKLTDLVSKASEGLYKLDIEDIEVDVLKSRVIASNVSLVADSARMKTLNENEQLPDDIYNVSVKELLIKGISPQDFINAKNISLSQIFLESPDIIITHQKRNYNRKDTGNLYSRIATQNESYELKNLMLQNIKLTYKNLDKKNSVSVLQNITANFDDIKIDSSTAKDSSRFLFAKDAVIHLKNYSTYTADKLYRFTIDSIALKPQQGTLRATAIRLQPQGNKDEFSKKLKVLKDRFDISINAASVKNINWWSLISNDGLLGDEMSVTGGFIKVYDDRRLPSAGSKMGNYPHQMLMKIDFPIKMNSISLNNIDVSYEEFNPVSDKTGMIEFGNTSGTISNITNIKEEIAKNPLMQVKAQTSFMNEGSLDAAFSFDLSNAANGSFTADALLGPMDGKKVNKAINGLALVSIEELKIDKLEAHVKGTNNRGNGTVTFAYQDLKIAALKKDKEEDDGLKKRGLLSFIANTFVVKSNSPQKGKSLKTQVVTYERDPNRSFFNLIWQTIAEGIILTARGK